MNIQNMYHSDIQPSYQAPSPYQGQLYPTCHRPLHPPPQQFGSRFQLPQQQYSNSHSNYQPSNQQSSPHCPNFSMSPPPPQPYYQSSGFDQVQSCTNFENLPPSLPYQPMQSPNFNQPLSPRPNFSQVHPPGSNFNQVSSHGTSFSQVTQTIPNFNQFKPNFNEPPLLRPNFNQIPPPKPVFNQGSSSRSTFNQDSVPSPVFNKGPILGPNFNHAPPPPIGSFNLPLSQSYETSCNQYYQPPNQVSSQQFFNKSLNFGYNTSNKFNPPHGQSCPQFQSRCEPSNHQYPYQQNSTQYLPRQELSQPKANFRAPGKYRCLTKNKFSSSQQDFLRNKFHPKQQYQNCNMTGINFNNKEKSDGFLKKDKVQIACNKGDCDFVGHASAVKEHQNLHHRFGLHKKVLYSNSSDAVKRWIEERKKNWPTKETAKLKLEIQNEKVKRGERIADEDFNRFNNKNDKLNRNGSGRLNNRKRTKFENAFVEHLEEPMNGNLKRFAGINDVLIKQLEDLSNNEKSKLGSLKLLEEYEFSDNHSDDEPPEEITIIKKTTTINEPLIIKETNTVSSLESVTFSAIENIELNKSDQGDINIDYINKTKIETTSSNISVTKSPGKNILLETTAENVSMEKLVNNNSIEKSVENSTLEFQKYENNQKRKRQSKKEKKNVKIKQPPRTPRNEVMERKAALLEALMGNLMRSERNTITQCICYIRNNMHRFIQTQTT
ncbi:FMR1-interacting protein NUFIP1 [Daktulosphaira vitifoliae]|uniref:FMR1-interacting protein NUFIP1 n=1 Tax=Daktulosphaira vitifoliae TaxID=58002 RepID=UPI0021A9F0DF|nr:FMR1-interacting protein NUFIP1 [Daktulosphaira vitifoliae]XP_050537037.1 FMR1-interacting protein NUFIP1 [Daktulosphaira vitifoliae]